MARNTLIEPGYLYGITHPSWPGFIKIGKARFPERRLRTLNTGDPYRRYQLQFTILCPNYHLAELAAHRVLNGYRVENTEWFQIHPDDALELILDNLDWRMNGRTEYVRYARLGGDAQEQIWDRMAD